MERALAAIHQALRGKEPITLVFGAIDGRTSLIVECADHLDRLVTGPIAANYPSCSLATVATTREAPPLLSTWSAELELTPELFPILRHAQFEDMLNGTFADPLSGILRAIRPDERLNCRVEIQIAPAAHGRAKVAGNAVRLLDREFFRSHHRLAEFYAAHVTRPHRWLFTWPLRAVARPSNHSSRGALDMSAGRVHDRESQLQSASDKIGGHLFETHIRLIVRAPRESGGLAIDRIHQMHGAFGAFTQSRLATFRLGPIRRGEPRHRKRRGFLMSHEELATLWHPPTATTEAEKMQTSEFRELEPPATFHSGEEPRAITIGRVLFRDDERLVGIDEDARRRHMYIVGSTGAGKSTLLLNLIHQDMQAGRGLTVIDVHGDLAEAALRLVPKHRTNDVIAFDAASEHIVPFNPLACPDPSRVDQVTSGVVSAIKKLNDSWGPRLDNLLRSAVFASVEQGGTMLDVWNMLTDKAYRDRVVYHVSDELVQSFWTHEFASWNATYRTEAVSSVTNKLMPFLTSRRLRGIVASSDKQTLDLRNVMDAKQILIANISRGRLGQDNATLLGSLLLTSIEQAALTRADIPEEQRNDHYLYLDEFQSLVTPSTSIMLSESRKYRLCLTLSHQLTKQLDPATYHAVVGNCGTILSFRVGLEDAELLAPAMSKHAGQLTPADLANLPNYTAYARVLIDGHPSRPFSLRTLPPVASEMDPDRAETVRRASNHRYAARIVEELARAA